MPTNPTADYWTRLEAEHLELQAKNRELRAALEQIDAIGNGLSKDDEKLTAYVSLLRCGSLARAALAKARGQ